ncbi:hypothetical protein PZA11_001066 [Diplocarpon coronariae]|uniref:Uncharacterized protein n=1 Tax=Diplocarpon coronariae TaxID=2795749 RepID=A0A218YR43_9HELO|nr:hypothetical protein JHW43_003629 [Diplocarpon mali]OWO92779.1 hypothetical protein B2J93_1102 [Marssonina coronariae]
MPIFNSASTLLFAICTVLGPLAAAQDQNVGWNQVVNLNGNMQLNRVIFPDNSKIETYSQTQRQMIVNQSPSTLSANHVVGSTGQPFVQLSQNSMTIQTNGATDLVAAQIELPIDPNVMQQMNVSPENTFVAMMSQDRQAWIVMEGIKAVNTTDNTVRIVKMTNIDGEYMAIGRQTTETSNVLSPFGQQVNVSGAGIQEIEFSDGMRMSVKASQPMTINTNVVNGVSTSMTAGVGAPLNNFRYLVTSNLGGVNPTLNNEAAVVQLPLNTNRLMAMAKQMGIGESGSVQLGIAQRGLLQNPGGATGNLNPSKRQDNNNPSNTNGNNPVATQLLLSPTFTPVMANTVLDMNSGRIAVQVPNINGEFIITMAKGEAAPAGEQPGQGPSGLNGTSTGAEASTSRGAGTTVSMIELNGLIQRQKNGGVFLASDIMTGSMKQQGQTGPTITVKGRGAEVLRRAQSFFA